MIIDVSNAEIINTKEVYIHDDIFEELWFNREGKQLHLLILKTEIYKSYTIDFFRVIGFEMTACDFWGRAPHILDFEYVERKNNTLIPKLFEKKEKGNYKYSSLRNQEDYIETVITFSSGDQLRIACESIVII